MTLHPLELAAHGILGCRSRGVRLNPAMRLVALTMLLWESVWDRAAFDYDELADRTSLTPAQVAQTIDQLEQAGWVEQQADGWRFLGKPPRPT